MAGGNEPVGLTIVARNDSSSSVKSMHVEILQVCTWYAQGQRQSKTRTVASTVVPGSDLGEVRWAAEEGNQRGRSAIAVADEARTYLQDLLTAGAGTRYEILVPDNCFLTLKTGLVEVRHLLSVRLKTPRCITSPNVCMPFRVQANTMAVGMGATPEETPVGLPSVEAMPCAATGGERSGDEIRVVSVPQSAVSTEFSCDIPHSSAPTKAQYSP